MHFKRVVSLLPLSNVKLIVRGSSQRTGDSSLASGRVALPFDQRHLTLVLQWERITASRIAVIYIVFSIFNCIIQLVFQAHAFTINKQAADLLYGLVYIGNASLPGFFVFSSGSQLHFCDHVPKSLSTESCTLVWNGRNGTNSTSTGASLFSVFENDIPSAIVERGVHTTTNFPNSPAFDGSTVTLDLNSFKAKRFLRQPRVNLADYSPVQRNGSLVVSLGSTRNVTLERNCLLALNWPVQT
jgi:hypothetical protein